jgi:hypothetical protein
MDGPSRAGRYPERRELSTLRLLGDPEMRVAAGSLGELLESRAGA